MSISSQLKPIPLAQAGEVLRALAQASGQTVDAKVLATLGNGVTQVQIGRQVLALQIPDAPAVGTTLMLAVQKADRHVQLNLVSSQPAPAVSGAASAAAAQAASLPATTVQLSTAALSGAPQKNLTPATAQPAPTLQPGIAARAVSAPASPPSIAVPPAGNPSVAVRQVAPILAQAQVQAALPMTIGEAVLASTPLVPPSSAQAQVAHAASSAPAAPPPSSAPAMATAMTSVRPAVPYASAANSRPSVAHVPAMTGSPSLGQPMSQGAPLPRASQNTAGTVPMSARPAEQTQTAEMALNRMVQTALPRQDSVVGLATVLAQVVGRIALPPPVMKATQQVLAQRLVLDGGKLDGAVVQAAVRGSGVFQEALLASGQFKAAGGDLKSALLGLQRQLGAWLGDQPPVQAVGTVPPPVKGQVPRARFADRPAADLPEEPELAGKMLLERTEAAISRLRLHQAASLPDPQAPRSDVQWSLDLPVTVAGHQALLQMQIHRDAEGDASRPEERGWQVRFAINLSEAGEIGAQISLRGHSAGVLLWAEQDETAKRLSQSVEELRADLQAAGLMPGALVVRAGAPVNPAAPNASGHFVDAVR